MHMKTLINIKTEKETKEKAQEAARNLGLPLSAIMNAYLREFIRSKAVTFSQEPIVRSEIKKLLHTAHRDFKTTKNIFGPFATGKKMDTYLDA